MSMPIEFEIGPETHRLAEVRRSQRAHLPKNQKPIIKVGDKV